MKEKEALFKNILWVIENHPESKDCEQLCNMYSPQTFKWTSNRLQIIEDAWNKQIKLNPENANVFYNAANFFMTDDYDWRRAEKLLKRAKSIDKSLAKPARSLAYAYRFRAANTENKARTKLVKLTLKEVEDAVTRKKEHTGERIGVLTSFTPLAIKYDELKLANSLTKKLKYYCYCHSDFPLWRHYAYLYSAWIATKEDRQRSMNANLKLLKKWFDKEPSHVATGNAALSFVQDCIESKDEMLAQRVLKILLRGARLQEDLIKNAELKEWSKAIKEGRRANMPALKKKMDRLY